MILRFCGEVNLFFGKNAEKGESKKAPQSGAFWGVKKLFLRGELSLFRAREPRKCVLYFLRFKARLDAVQIGKAEL